MASSNPKARKPRKHPSLVASELREWADAVIMDTTPADFAGAEEAISELYRLDGRLPPVFVRVASPLAAELALVKLGGMADAEGNFDRVIGTFYDNLMLQTQTMLKQDLDAPTYRHVAETMNGLWPFRATPPRGALSRAMRRLSGLPAASAVNVENVIGCITNTMERQFQLVGEVLADLPRSNLVKWLSLSLRARTSALPMQLLIEHTQESLEQEALVDIISRIWLPGNPPTKISMRKWLHGQLDVVENTLWRELVQMHFYRDCLYGQHSALPVAIMDFALQYTSMQLSAADLQRHQLWKRVSQCVGWWAGYNGFCILVDRPERQQVNAEGQLHATDGPAIRWRDGWAVYALEGVAVPQRVVTEPSTVTFEHIQQENNAEVRRLLIAAYGVGNWMKKARAKVVEYGRRDHPVVGLRGARLLRIIDDEGVAWACVECVNSTPEPDGSYKRYTLSVNPSHYGGRAGRELLAAMASTWRQPDGRLMFMRPEDYLPTEET